MSFVGKLEHPRGGSAVADWMEAATHNVVAGFTPQPSRRKKVDTADAVACDLTLVIAAACRMLRGLP